jgi:acetolactate synthase-1/3 small subunit
MVVNRPGVLIRIALVFARRAYNIDTLVVSPSQDPMYSMMNVTAWGDAKTLDQILKQLNKLIDVVHATDRTEVDTLQRELALIKVVCTLNQRAELLQLSRALECRILDIDDDSIIVQASGTSDRIDRVLHSLTPYTLGEVVRTGRVLMARGSKSTA